MDNEDLLWNIDLELKNIISIRQSLESILRDFNSYTKVLMNVEKRVKDLEMRFEKMTNEQNPNLVMYR